MSKPQIKPTDMQPIICTECAGVTWYKDRHFEGGDYKYHIVTFDNISPDCLRLIHKGSGK